MRDAEAFVIGKAGQRCAAYVSVKIKARLPRAVAGGQCGAFMFPCTLRLNSACDSVDARGSASRLIKSFTRATSDSCENSLQGRHSVVANPRVLRSEALKRRDLRSDLCESGTAKHGSKQCAPNFDNSFNAVAGEATTYGGGGTAEETQPWRVDACGEEDNTNPPTSFRSAGLAQLGRGQFSEDDIVLAI